MLTTSEPGTEPTCVLGKVRFERKAEIGSFSLFDRVVMQSRIDQK